jgi:two-component system, cell cycle sensor histidine kinase and response regulator CckA
LNPFSPPRRLGKGTGLGLATVYGIVRQNGGFISVASRTGGGGQLQDIPAPQAEEAEPSARVVAPSRWRTGSETILLVEDEPMILNMTTLMLKRQGYRVLAAATPAEAVALGREHQGAIDLLLTDVVMPEMNGRELARLLQTIKPQLQCLFMSGYTASVIADHGILDKGVDFVQKPFTSDDLSAKIRAVLDRTGSC